MVEVRYVHNHSIEIASPVGESLSIIAAGPGVGIVLFDRVNLAAIHIAEASPFYHRMAFQSAALQAANAAHADLEDAQLAVLVDLRARVQREGRKTGGNDRAGSEKTPPRDRRK